eukprot:2379013-Rhodomonas_salina.1
MASWMRRQSWVRIASCGSVSKNPHGRLPSQPTQLRSRYHRVGPVGTRTLKCGLPPGRQVARWDLVGC